MEKIKFLKDSMLYTCDLTPIKNGVYKITSDTLPAENIVLSGFEILNENNFSVMSDCSNFTTKYKESDGNSVYVSTGEIFVEPEIITNENTTEPTEEELAEIERQNKIYDLTIQYNTKKEQIAKFDYIFTKRQEIDEIKDETLKAEQLKKFYEDYTNLQDIILLRISLRDEINSLESELAAL